MNILEKYNPKTLDDVIGQDIAIRQIRNEINEYGIEGRIFFLQGSTGTGKTSIARAIAAEYSDPLVTYEFVGRELRIDQVIEWKSNFCNTNLYGVPCYIIDEAQGIPAQCMEILLQAIDLMLRNGKCVVIFTTMSDDNQVEGKKVENWKPLKNRCSCIEMAETKTYEFQTTLISYIIFVAKKEGIEISKEKAREIARKGNWSVRAAIGELSLLKNKDKNIVIKKPRRINGEKSMIESCYEVLKWQGSAMSAPELYGIIGVQFPAKSRGIGARNVKETLRRDITRLGDNSRFGKDESGKFFAK